MRIVMQSSWLMDASSHREMGEGQQVRAGQRLFWVGKLAHAIANTCTCTCCVALSYFASAMATDRSSLLADEESCASPTSDREARMEQPVASSEVALPTKPLVAVFATALFILALFFAGVWPTVPPPAELKPSLPVVVKSPPVGFAQRRVDFDRPSRTQRGPRSAANHEKAETAEELRGSRIREAATDPTSMFDMSTP